MEPFGENYIFSRLKQLAKDVRYEDFQTYETIVKPWVSYSNQMLAGVSHAAANIYAESVPHSKIFFTDHGIRHSLRVAEHGNKLIEFLLLDNKIPPDWIELLPHFHCASLLLRIPVIPATCSERRRPPFGAKRRWAFSLYPSGRIESRISSFFS